jgi:hypothetical protein
MLWKNLGKEAKLLKESLNCEDEYFYAREIDGNRLKKILLGNYMKFS